MLANQVKTWKWNENENESLLIPAVQHVIYHRINLKNKIDLRLTQIIEGIFFCYT